MTDNLKIRKATSEDLPSVLNLYATKDLDDGDMLELDEANRIFNKFSTYPNYSLYVAVIGDIVVGTFALLIMDNLGHLGKPSGVVEDVVVHDDYRSQGIGAKMMESAINTCREYGCYKLALSSNMIRERAHQFYENYGFKKHGYSFLIEI